MAPNGDARDIPTTVEHRIWLSCRRERHQAKLQSVPSQQIHIKYTMKTTWAFDSANNTRSITTKYQGIIARQSSQAEISSSNGQHKVTLTLKKILKAASYCPNFTAFELDSASRNTRVWLSHLYGDSVITTIYYGGMVELAVTISDSSALLASTFAANFSKGVDASWIKMLLHTVSNEGEVEVQYTSTGFGPSFAIISVEKAIEFVDSFQSWRIEVLQAVNFDRTSLVNIAGFLGNRCIIATEPRLWTVRINCDNWSASLIAREHPRGARWCKACLTQRFRRSVECIKEITLRLERCCNFSMRFKMEQNMTGSCTCSTIDMVNGD